MCGLATHERPPFRAAGLAPAACYTSALRAVCQELRGCTGLALLGKHAVIGHELFACFDLDGGGFLDLRSGEKVGHGFVVVAALLFLHSGGASVCIIHARDFHQVAGLFNFFPAPEHKRKGGVFSLLDLIAKAAPLLIGVEGKTASRFEDSDGFLFCEYAGRDCGVEDDLLVCHDGFLLAFVVVLAVIT